MLNLAGAYASGLTSDARILVDLNGSNAASVPLAQTRGEVFENNTIPLPLAKWRPGLNRVAIMAQVPAPADETCGLNATDSKRERFLILDRASLSIPTLAHAARIPDLAATTSGALAFVKSERRPRLVLPTLDKDTVAAAATPRRQTGGRRRADDRFRTRWRHAERLSRADPRRRPGAVPVSLDAVGAGPRTRTRSGRSGRRARKRRGRPASPARCRPRPWTGFAANLPPRCSLPELTLRAPAPSPTIASAAPAEARRSPQARLSDGDLVTKWDETLRARHPVLEAADGVVERGRALAQLRRG